MALSVLQIKISSRASGGTIARTFDSNVTAGSLIVAHTAAWSSTGGEPTVSDPTNGTYPAASTSGYTFAGDTNSRITLNSFSNNASSGSLTVTSNPPGATSDNDLTLIEVGGAATSSARDVSVTNSGTIDANGSPAVATGTLAQAAEILISSFSHVGPDRTLTGDAADSFTTANENESNSGGQTFHVQYKIVSATTSVTVNGTISGTGVFTWFTGVASFKEAAGGSPVLEQTHYRWRNDDGTLGELP